ncbi:hypothetical protein RZS28_19840 (plasmid) [Methylocapsa polymorpha]|uniref:Uncharacterized protein n=1 Tax=Methylocapsa polymorpha TaxID=3080828 RepID=A0ABZ0HZ51_9HYPH|nr:hypothetical protein [Methylocapsa sp. RX1]WOJ91699.1 hypothetical protein RZS28_19840 [Methylocapsa sp. RX1]
MPIYKIKGTDEVRTTYEIYAGLDSLEDLPGARVISVDAIGGAIESVQLVDAAPAGMIPIKPAWKSGVALKPAR